MMQRKILPLFIFFLLFSPRISADRGSKKVLLLNSYHKGYIWSDEITRGLEDSLKSQNIDLYVEFMDTKRLFDESYLNLLEALYRDKYSNTSFDLIVTSDNNAINFYNERGPRVFGDLPQVFCGYNFLKPEDLSTMKNATGINEEGDIRGNIDLIMSLHEDTERILILAENTTSGKQVQKEVETIRRDPVPGQPEIQLIFDVNKEELINLVREQTDRTVILLTFFFVDRDGETYTAAEIASLISQYTHVPLYGSWNFSFGSGIIGGSLVSGYNQGLKAGDMALQILNGIPVNAIPVEYDTPFRLKFDYRELIKFGIPLTSLPEEGEIYFQPSTFYSRNTRLIWTVIIIFLIQVIIIIGLIYLNRARKIVQKQLAEQGIFLKLIISHIPAKIYWKDRELNYLGCNRIFSESVGLEEEDIIGRKSSGVRPPYLDSAREDQEDRSILDSGKPLFDRETVQTDDKGEKRWIRENRIPIRDERGNCIGILGLEADITEQKESQMNIERAERKLRTIIDAIPSHIFVKNREGRFLMANAYTARFSGKDKEKLEGSLHSQVRAGLKQTEKVLKDDRYVLDTGKPLSNIQENLFSAEGREYWFQATKIPCPPELFDEPAILGVAMDITALKKAEKELRNREEDLQTTLNSIADGVISTDWDGNIVQMNPVAEELTGWTFGEAKDKPVTDVIPLYASEDRKTLLNPVSQILNERRTDFFSISLVMVNRAGEILPLNFSCAPIKNESANIRGAVLVFRDMTEENQLRKQLRHTEKMDTLGQLAGGITHDFNNMLGGILGSSQLLKQYLNGEKEGKEYLDLIINTTQKAADLTKELLVFSRRREKLSTTFDLEKEIQESIKLLRRTLDRRISLTSELTGDYCPVIGDPSQIQSALINLGINASHAMLGGGEITIKTDKIYLDRDVCDRSLFDLKPGPYLNITFSDTGAGIPEKILSRIFEPFFTTKEEGKGTGLGLAAVYRTVQKHGGSIDVESRVNEGTSFHISLPLMTGEDTVVREVSEERKAGTGHILVIDDDLAMRITAKEILKDLGYRVSVEEDGRKGLDFFRENASAVDLVILDMIMPNMNGRDCFLAMKEIDPEIKVILTSGFTSEEDMKDMKEAGLAGFCRKPYTIAQLSQIIERVLKN